MKHIQRNREGHVGIEPTQIHHEPFLFLENFSESSFVFSFGIYLWYFDRFYLL